MAFGSDVVGLSEIVFLFIHQWDIRLSAVGTELDAISAVVISGTLLTGGAGFVGGALIGILIEGWIETDITPANG